MGEKKHSSYFLQSILKRLSSHGYFSYSRENRFRGAIVNYNDVNLEENSKLNVAITFQFLFFGIRIDQSIAFQVTKVTKGEDPSAEVPRRGEVRA